MSDSRPTEPGAVCQHGSLARSCDRCEAMTEIDRLTARIAALEASNARLREEVLSRRDWDTKYRAESIARRDGKLSVNQQPIKDRHTANVRAKKAIEAVNAHGDLKEAK